MARNKRLYYSNAVYHVIVRGNNRHFVLQDNSAKEKFLQTIERYRAKFKFVLHAFVLMDNHAHLIIQVQDPHNISRVMQSILLSYSGWFRRTHDYVGYVWQGRFKSFCISRERYILECIKYIHQNPVRSKMAGYSEEYPFSSARYYMGKANDKVDGLLTVERFAIF